MSMHQETWIHFNGFPLGFYDQINMMEKELK